MGRFPKLGTSLSRDFRNSYNTGTDQVDIDLDTALTTANTAKQTADESIVTAETVRSEFDRVVAEAGENNPEVVQARGTAVNLNARLDGVDAQMAQTADKIEVTNNNVDKVSERNKSFVSLRPKTIRPLVTFIDDDNYSTFLTNIKPICDDFGIKFTLAVNPGRLNTTNATTGVDFLTDEELFNLYSGGYDVAAHGWDHTKYSEKTDQEKENDIIQTNEYLQNLGIDVQHFVVPYNEELQSIQEIARKYYLSAADRGDIINQTPISTMSVNRIAMYGTTLSNLQAKVDDAIANNGWAVFYIHSQDMTSTDVQMVRDLVSYAQSQSVDILTYNDAFNVFSNIYEYGISGDYGGDPNGLLNFGVISPDGYRQFSKEMMQYKGNRDNYTLSSHPSEFKVGVTYTTQTTTTGVDFPESTSGVWITVNPTNASVKYNYTSQFWHPSESNNVYKRAWNGTTGQWMAWENTKSNIEMDNIGVQTFDFGTVPANSTVEVILPLTGVHYLDSPIVTPVGQAPTGIIWSTYIDNADEVRVRVANVTGADIAYGAVGYNIKIIKN